jgi:cytochrome c-type biogenesis protein CcmE
MTPRARARLTSIIIVLAGLGLAVALTLYGLSGKITYFHSPSEIATLNAKQLEKTIRVGGMVKAGSLKQTGEKSVFVITDYKADLTITYQGVLPDLFREGQGVVVYGRYDTASTHFTAKDVLAKHDENYMPPEVKKALDQNK